MNNPGRGTRHCASTNIRYYHKSIRLKGYDYSQPGAYFLTLCTNHREELFGNITDGEMVLNEWGKVVSEELVRSESIRSELELDKWVIMPNHIHVIVVIVAAHRHAPESKSNETTDLAHRHAPQHIRSEFKRQPRSIASFIAGFKSITTKRINILRDMSGQSIWQRNSPREIGDETCIIMYMFYNRKKIINFMLVLRKILNVDWLIIIVEK